MQQTTLHSVVIKLLSVAFVLVGLRPATPILPVVGRTPRALVADFTTIVTAIRQAVVGRIFYVPAAGLFIDQLFAHFFLALVSLGSLT